MRMEGPEVEPGRFSNVQDHENEEDDEEEDEDYDDDDLQDDDMELHLEQELEKFWMESCLKVKSQSQH